MLRNVLGELQILGRDKHSGERASVMSEFSFGWDGWYRTWWWCKLCCGGTLPLLTPTTACWTWTSYWFTFFFLRSYTILHLHERVDIELSCVVNCVVVEVVLPTSVSASQSPPSSPQHSPLSPPLPPRRALSQCLKIFSQR